MSQPAEKYYQAIVINILKSIRGERSQGQLNRKLGYQYNQISRWETGFRKIRWKEFLDFCTACKVDTKSLLTETLQISRHQEWKFIFRFLYDINGSSIVETQTIGTKKIQQWYQNDSNPFLVECFEFLDSYTSFFPKFLNYLCPLESLRGFVDSNTILSLESIDHIDYPLEFKLLIITLQCKTHKNKPFDLEEYLIQHYGLERQKVNRSINQATEKGLIRKKGEKYIPVNELFGKYLSDSKTTQSHISKTLSNTGDSILEKLAEIDSIKTKGKFLSQNLIFGSSEEHMRKVLKVTLDYFHNIYKLEQEFFINENQTQQPFDRVGFVKIHLFDDIVLKDLKVKLKTDE